MKTLNLSIEDFGNERSHDFTCNVDDIKKIQVICEASSVEMRVIVNDKHIFVVENIGDDFNIIGKLNEN